MKLTSPAAEFRSLNTKLSHPPFRSHLIDIMWPNLIGVVAATIASFLVGAVWYSPPVFGKMWMSLMNKTDEDWKKNRMKSISVGLVANFITAALLGVFLKFASAADWMEGAEVALLAWVAFAFTYHLTSWAFEGRKGKLFGIDVAHSFVIFLVMGAVLGIWG